MTRRQPKAGAPTVAPDPLDNNPELAADLARLRDLLAQSDVEGARVWVKELEQRWPESDRVRHMARVLTPPVARVVTGGTGRSFDRERAWLREHAREYPGCWIAVFEDRLVAADPDLGKVLAAARQSQDPQHTLIHFQPRAGE